MLPRQKQNLLRNFKVTSKQRRLGGFTCYSVSSLFYAPRRLVQIPDQISKRCFLVDTGASCGFWAPNGNRLDVSMPFHRAQKTLHFQGPTLLPLAQVMDAARIESIMHMAV
jgi:hypothetical protein